jgi:hypothetical protein
MFTPINVAPEIQAVTAVVNIGISFFEQAVSNYNTAYNLVWNNPSATADIIVTAMGTQAQYIFTASAATATYLNSVGANVVTSSPQDSNGNYQWNFTMNADGSITLAPNPAYNS